ncbi:Chromatin assembly factor 1 subunit [Entomophthora muscae]|nr:Chromatin assembly factor 1 subunit [Entomophthora muscae]
MIGESGKLIHIENSSINTNFGRGEDEYCLERWKAVTVLRGSLADVYALAWSPTGQFLISGSVDNTAKIWDISSSRCIAIINEHRHYVQGVAWDPCGEYLVTQSSDRSVKFHTFTYKPSVGKFLTKCISSHGRLSSIKPNEVEEDPSKPALAYNHLYQSETLASFFRRPDITPDGALIITPAGICKEGEAGEATYAVHIYPRNMVLSPPLLRLNGFPKPPIAIRCSPIIYELKADCESVLNLNYYCVFAVATQDSVFVFNTQHSAPIAFVSNLHNASLTDVSWSCDGCTLLASSADGFASIFKFSPGELGVPVSKPVLIKSIQPVVNLESEPLPVDSEPIDLVSPTVLTPRSKVSVLDMMRNASSPVPNPALSSQGPLQAPLEEILQTDPPVPPQNPSAISAPKKRRIAPTFVSHLS